MFSRRIHALAGRTEPAAKDAPGIVALSVRCRSKPRHHEDNQQGDPHEILHHVDRTADAGRRPWLTNCRLNGKHQPGVTRHRSQRIAKADHPLLATSACRCRHLAPRATAAPQSHLSEAQSAVWRRRWLRGRPLRIRVHHARGGKARSGRLTRLPRTVLARNRAGTAPFPLLKANRIIAAEPLSYGWRGRRHCDPDDQEKGKRAHQETPRICGLYFHGTENHRYSGFPGTATILGRAPPQRQQQKQ